MDRTPTAHVLTYGCQMNEFDSDMIVERLVQMGFGYEPEWKRADLVVFNTCAVRDNSAERVFGVLGHAKSLKRERPAVKIAVHGCMAAHEPERLEKQASFVDILIRTNEVDDLIAGIERAFPDLPMGRAAAAVDGNVPMPFPDETPFKRFLAIMQGCDFFCTFCVVPYTRGRERSFPADEILGRLDAFAAEGVREVTLLGQNVNSYRSDGLDFAGLLARAASRHPELKLRFTTSNPWDFRPGLCDVIAAHPNIAKHIHLPLQSGSDRILEEMNRTYSRDQYLRLVEMIRGRIPDLALTTDIITGFPGEEDEDHEATLDVMREVRFDSAYMFYFSERSGTPAADLPRQVPLELRKSRLRQVIDLQIELSRAVNQRYLGRVERVLVEGPARKSPGKAMGRLDHNKAVLFPADPAALAGRYVPVRVHWADAFTLEGEQAGEAEAAAPVAGAGPGAEGPVVLAV